LADRLLTRLALQKRDLLAAEHGLASPERRVHRLVLRLAEVERRLQAAGPALLDRRALRVRNLEGRLRARDPRRRVPELVLRTERTRGRLVAALRRRLQALSGGLAAREAGLRGLDPEAVLERGYSITVNAATGRVVRRVADVAAGVPLLTRLGDGRVGSTVTDVRPGRASPEEAR
jgi:exodeoxyribonuclease VII large subunit